jgi:hypothetical protein
MARRFDMHAGRNWGIRRYSIAALLVSVAMAVSDVSGATAVNATASGAWDTGHNLWFPVSKLMFFTGKTQQRNKRCQWCAWDGSAFGAASNSARGTASVLPTSFEFIALNAATPTSNPTVGTADVSGIRATDIELVSAMNGSLNPVEFAGGDVGRLNTRMHWRSNSFSIAGSRAWSKIIKFSSTGINVRVPLN